MKFKQLSIAALVLLVLSGCAKPPAASELAATTLPVWEFTSQLCRGTELQVTRLVTEQVSCLHDYSLNVRQVKAAEGADAVVISGAGLEDFLNDLLLDAPVIDASGGIPLLCAQEEGHDDHDAHGGDGHHHEEDPHIWLSPSNAKVMAENICAGLSRQYPQYSDQFHENLAELTDRLVQLQQYGEKTLSRLKCRNLITFHDGFSYFAQAFDLTILEALEEESGSEASAKELIHLIEDVEDYRLPAIFTEVSGSTSAAEIIARETGCAVYALDMAMSGDSYFTAMYHNIDIIKEALG